ncbi:MAG: hypothetical protein EA425_04220 [Puniceicoccaceae bacterium]|nr:MAG: hypothetical protein EA425_04220 [Puniceicoccaceae bacterium]
MAGPAEPVRRTRRHCAHFFTTVRNPARVLLPLFLLAAAGATPACSADPPPPRTEIVRDASGAFHLLRDGEPFFIRGAGGHHHLDRFQASGGNTLRTWGADQLERRVDDLPFLDYAHRRGLAVVAGIWVQHERHGFDYRDPERVEAQRGAVRATVERYRHHPAILLWGLGNEVEAFRGDDDDAHLWREWNHLARIVKETDPSRPVMATVAGVTPAKLAKIQRHCPDFDILGVNAYAAAIRTGHYLRQTGFERPFILAEFGPRGHWEVARTPWGAPLEPTAEEKARHYLETYRQVMEDAGDLCLGTFAFLWGHKQELTPTWYGMFLETGEKLPAVDAITYAWRGSYPSERCPELLAVDFPAAGRTVAPGTEWQVTAQARDPQDLVLTFSWEVLSEQLEPAVGGDAERRPPAHPEAILEASAGHALIRAPETPGAYRLFLTVRNAGASATTANFPFRVE